jgi:hypothetical protein
MGKEFVIDISKYGSTLKYVSYIFNMSYDATHILHAQLEDITSYISDLSH